MASPSFSVNPTAQFPYVEELREFFASHRFPYGSPVDIVKLAEAVSTPGAFHDEMTSMVRSILLREGGTLPRAHLLSIVATAIGGPEMEATAPGFPEPVLKLVSFLGAARRNQFGVPREDLLETGPEATAASARSAQPETVLLAASLIEPPPVEMPLQRDFGPFSRSRERFEQAENAALVGNLRTFPTPLSVPQFSDIPEANPKSGATPRPWMKRPALWIPVVCMVLLAFATSLLLHQRHESQARWAAQHTRAIYPSPIVAVPASAKPTPYSPPLGREAAGRNEPSGQHSGSASRPGQQPTAEADTQGTERERTQSPAPIQAPVYRVTPFGPFKSYEPDSKPANATPAQPSSARQSRSDAGKTPNSIRTVPLSSYRGQRSLSVSSGVMAANLISAPPPDYPALAKLAHIEGEVILQAVVSKNGAVIATHVLRGHRLLRGAASNAVSHWRYRPYVFNGKPTDVATVVSVNFRRH
ncbi:MAG: energy transducer TonB [Acidobacteriaceae bacterium]